MTGAVGESLLHLCLLNGSNIHIELAKRLIKLYPKQINDIYMSDEYYGKFSIIFNNLIISMF
jgi:transient receptor potential cation channel subfamily V protein 5